MHFMKEFPPDTLQYAQFFYANAPNERYTNNVFVKPANACAKYLVSMTNKPDMYLTNKVLDSLQELGIVCCVREEGEPLSKAVTLTKPKKYNIN